MLTTLNGPTIRAGQSLSDGDGAPGGRRSSAASRPAACSVWMADV
jgi:hypothetical protein